MLVKDLMTPSVQVVGPKVTIRDVAQKMKKLNVGVLPVCDNDRLVGTVTDRDIVVRGIAEKLDLDRFTARDVMTSPIQYCHEDDELEVAARMMDERQIRRVLVLNRQKRLVGILSRADLDARGKKEIKAA